MLVLSRRIGEKIVVPQCGLVLTVLEVRGQQIRLGIVAPQEVAVFREEIWEGTQVFRDGTESPTSHS